MNSFIHFHKFVETQLDTKIKILQSDNGGEYLIGNFLKYLDDHGIRSKCSCPKTPKQNGMAERKH